MNSIGAVRTVRAHVSQILFALTSLVLGGAIGVVGTRSIALGVASLAAIIVGLAALSRPVCLAFLAVVGAFLTQRLGGTSTAPGSSGGVSYADALLALAS